MLFRLSINRTTVYSIWKTHNATREVSVEVIDTNQNHIPLKRPVPEYIFVMITSHNVVKTTKLKTRKTDENE